jgi:glutaredoxin 3
LNASVKILSLISIITIYSTVSNITIYTTAYCPFCVQAKRLLEHKKLTYNEISVDKDPAIRREMMQKSQRRTLPQIFNGDTHIGDCTELFAFESKGKLDSLLAQH